MTGSGTQADPYIVENYADFCQMTGGSSTYYKLGADIDFAETDRSPSGGAITINFKELDGDGHTISNFFRRVTSSSTINSMFAMSSSNCLIKNTNFVGIYLAGGIAKFHNISNQDINLYKCKLSCRIVDTNTATAAVEFLRASYIRDCEILFEGQSNYIKPLIYSLGVVEGSLIKYNIECQNTATNAIFGTSLNHCGVTGRIKDTNAAASEHAFKFTSGQCVCSYFALETAGIGSITFGSFGGTNFYDKEVMTGMTTGMPENLLLYALTTEQCKNAEYLQSIGFPCSQGETA